MAPIDDGDGAIEGDRLPSSAYLDSLVTALRAYEHRVRHFSQGAIALPADMLTRVSPRDESWVWLREALLPPATLGTVPPQAFAAPGERLGVAEPALLRRALAVRALYARRSAVRRCIERDRLDRMRVAVGSQTFDVLRGMAAADGETTLPLPDILDAAALAQEGFWRLRRENAIATPSIVSMVALQLEGAPAPGGYPCEPGDVGVSEEHERPAAPGREGVFAASREVAERSRFFARLPLLIPELP